ncbi:MAG: InlB B-repeat-containing protein, partial [Clostridiales bacterium]|nr:InlB B-repeat-containing protein [Clostridiales bacterium]
MLIAVSAVSLVFTTVLMIINTNPERYKVSFETNGGSLIETLENIEDGKLIKKPTEDPTKVGHTFDGYYKDAEFSELWLFDKHTVTQDTTIYVKWSVNTYTVRFSIEGVIAENLDIDALYGSTIAKPDFIPQVTGRTFSAWYKDESLAVAWNFESDTIGIGTVLYAGFDISKHTVMFESESVRLIDLTQVVYYGQTATLPSTTPSREGADFKYWAIEGTTAEYDFDTLITRDLNLVAIYKLHEFDVTFMAGQDVYCEYLGIEWGNAVAAPDGYPVSDGNLFVAWYNQATGAEFDFSTLIKSNVTLYAHYVDKQTEINKAEAAVAAAILGYYETIDGYGEVEGPDYIDYDFGTWYPNVYAATSLAGFNSAVEKIIDEEGKLLTAQEKDVFNKTKVAWSETFAKYYDEIADNYFAADLKPVYDDIVAYIQSSTYGGDIFGDDVATYITQEFSKIETIATIKDADAATLEAAVTAHYDTIDYDEDDCDISEIGYDYDTWYAAIKNATTRAAYDEALAAVYEDGELTEAGKAQVLAAAKVKW